MNVTYPKDALISAFIAFHKVVKQNAQNEGFHVPAPRVLTIFTQVHELLSLDRFKKDTKVYPTSFQ